MTVKSARRSLSGQGAKGLAFLIGLGVVLAALAIAPFLWQISLSAHLAESGQFLRLLEAKARANPQSAGPSPQDVETIFIKGTTSGLANAELQRLLVDTAQKHGMVVERTRPLPVEGTQGLASLRMEVNASGSIEALRNYLHGLETGAPLIFVNQVHISVAPAAQDGGEASDNLSVRLELEAFAWWEKA